jgi:DNA-binding response OmpR family regulator
MAAQAAAPEGAPHVDVLIVEDECLIADYLEDILAGTRFDVVGVAEAVPDALALAERTHPRLALVDLSLRDRLDGVEVARLLQERFGTAVLFVTGSPGAETQARAAMAGPVTVLRKPFLPRQLLHMLDAAARGLPH